VGGERRGASGLHEDSNDDWNLPSLNQIVERDGSLELNSILKHHDTGRLGGIILFWHINPVVASGPRKNPAVIECVLGDLPFGRTVLRFGIRAGRVIIHCSEKGKECEKQNNNRCSY